jgi:diguanylate cyclase
LHHDHFSIFTALSVVVAIFCGWTALDLFDRVRAHGRTTGRLWLAAAALAMGGGVWSMHFIAMLGFDPGSPVSYEIGLTVLSFLLAVVGTGIAFLFASRAGATQSGIVIAGVLMGGAVCTMHYVGMAALRTAGSLGYNPGLVVLSAVIAIVASTTALFAARLERSALWRAGAAVILGLAVVGMHYTAMAALKLTPIAGQTVLPGAPPVVLAVAVAAVTLFILFLALGASLVDQRNNLLVTIDAGGVGYWELALPSRELWVSERARRILDLADGAPFSQADFVRRLSPDDGARRAEALARALAGERDYDVEVQLQDTGRWIQLRGRLLRSRAGRPFKLAGVVTDVTDRRQAYLDLETSERRQRLLINELNHRVKNTLATIQSIAALTARRAPDMATFNRVFEARLIALSNTHNLLTANGWERADLRALLEQEFRPFAPEQVRLNGPDIVLQSAETLALGLVIHELATNAAKYGALSTPSGCVAVRWRQGEGDAGADDRLTIEWEETGGPEVRPPAQSGFGGRLIRKSLEGMLNGSAQIDYPPRGLRAVLRFPRKAPDHTTSFSNADL